MKKSINRKGFTLIELLVVVAIIGVLASVVLASVNSARTKGIDAAVKGNLDTIRSQAAIYYDDPNNGNGSYNITGNPVTTCNVGMFTDPNITAAAAAIKLDAGSLQPNCYADSAGKSYAVAAVLLTPNAGTFCVDSSGNSKILSTGNNSSVTATPNTTNAVLGTDATGYVCQ
jgi:prepilin-type N-terminal cleavage/methylation domain-containing protein